MLHSQYTASILGAMGAKHWIMRLCAGELDSGKAFRDILAEHAVFYEKLADLVKDVKWTGANSMFVEKPYHRYSMEKVYNFKNNDWVILNLERMGLPFYFSDTNSGAAFLEGDIIRSMSDEQIESIFEGSVFVSSDAAKDIIDRGFGGYLGVDVTEWDGILVKGETFDDKIEKCCTSQKNFRCLTPLNENVEALPVYYHGDNEICMKAGYLSDGTLMTCVIDLGTDPMEELTLFLENKPTEIKLLQKDGTAKNIEWNESDNSIYSLKVRVEPLYPVILLIN